MPLVPTGSRGRALPGIDGCLKGCLLRLFDQSARVRAAQGPEDRRRT